MRNPALERLAPLVGTWDFTLTNAWFLESMDVEQHGQAVVRWLGDAFLELTADMEGERTWHFVFGRSDVNDRSVVLYHDPEVDAAWTRLSATGYELVAGALASPPS